VPVFHQALREEARRKIIVVLARHRSYRDLARLLGVSPAAIHKYLSGKSMPGDQVIERALEIADRYEKSEIAREIARDIAETLEDFLQWALRQEVLDTASIEELGDIVARAKLSSIVAAPKH